MSENRGGTRFKNGLKVKLTDYAAPSMTVDDRDWKPPGRHWCSSQVTGHSSHRTSGPQARHGTISTRERPQATRSRRQLSGPCPMCAYRTCPCTGYGLALGQRAETRIFDFVLGFGALPPSPDTAHSPPLPSPIGCCSIRVENAPLASALRKEALGDGPVGEII